MTVEEFYEENYNDANHFYSYVRGIAVLSPRKLQEAMELYHQQQCKASEDIVSLSETSLGRSWNDMVTIYPNLKGWAEILELNLKVVGKTRSMLKATKTINSKKTEDGGYKDQLWKIMEDLGSMFYHGQDYFENTNVLFEK